MALTNTQLAQLINDNVPDNNIGYVTPELLREVLDGQNTSYLNRISDQQQIGLGEWSNSLSYQPGVGVIYLDAIYQALSQTSIGTFIPGEWQQISTFIPGAGGLGDYILKDEGIELDPNKITPTIATDSTISTLDTGFYKVEQNSSPVGESQEYPIIGQGLLQVYRHQSQSQTILFYYPMGDLTKYFVKRENGLWVSFFNNTNSALDFDNGLIDDDGTIGLGGSLNRDTTISLNGNILDFDEAISYVGVDFNTFTSNNLITKEYVDDTAVLTVNGVSPVSGNVNTPPTTTAGVLSRIYFTGDESVLVTGTYYDTNTTKGIASINEVVLNDDNEKEYFAQDLISQLYPIELNSQGGSYSAQLTAQVSSNAGDQRFTIEVYLADADGNPVESGIIGQPTGDLGVTVINILDSGIIDLQQNNISQVALTGVIPGDVVFPPNSRFRYHVSAAKVGADGGNVTMTVFYGANYSSYLDVPVSVTSDTTTNLSTVPGADVTAALDNLYLDYDNGLTNINGSVGLGGTLLGNISLTPDITDTYSFSIGSDSNKLDYLETYTRGGVYIQEGDYTDQISYLSLSDASAQIYGQDVSTSDYADITANGDSNGVFLQHQDSTHQFNSHPVRPTIELKDGTAKLMARTSISGDGFSFLNVSTTNGIEVQDGITSNGLFYSADYSATGIATHGDRWITDKGYVDSVSGGVYDNTVSKFKFKNVATIPVSPVPTGEVHYNTITNILYFSITDLNNNTNHQIVIGKTDWGKNTDLMITTGQWDSLNDNFAFGKIISNDGISNPNYLEVELDDSGTPASIFADDDIINVSVTASTKIEGVYLSVKYNETITKGDSLYIVGWDALGVPTVGKADNTVPFTKPCVGMASVSGVFGDLKTITKVGILEGIDTSLFPVGVKLYLSANGTFDVLENINGGAKQAVGTVVKSAFSDGIIFTDVDITQNRSFLKNKVSTFTLDKLSDDNTYTYYNNSTDGTATIDLDALSVGGETKILKLGTNKIDIVSLAGVNLIDPNGVALSGLNEVGIERLSDDSYGLTGQNYRLY
jgi:hypothetical protein